MLRHARSAVVRVAGEVDVLTAPDLRHALAQVVAERPHLVVVDLSKVGFLGCAGLSALVESHLRAEARTCVRVVATARVTQRPLRLTGLDRHLAVYDCLKAALTEPVRTDPAGS